MSRLAPRPLLAHAEVLTLSLFGRARWQRWRGGEPVGNAVELAWRDALLLAVLAVDGAQPRDHIVALLWPAAPSLQAGRLSLRQRLFQLRQLCGHALVDAGVQLQLHADGLECDLWPGQWETSGCWPEGRLLEGVESDIDPLDFDALSDWLAPARQRVERLWQESLWQAACRAEAAGDHPRTARLARQWLQHWPWSEEQWRRLIEALYLSGDLSAAHQAAESMTRVLDDDLGVPPGPETSALVSAVHQAVRDRVGLAHTISQAWRSSTTAAAGVGPPACATALTPAEASALRSLSQAATLLARALALIEVYAPGAAPVSMAARLLDQTPLELAAAWLEVEAAGVVRGDHITSVGLRTSLLAGIPATLLAHLRGALEARA